MSADAVIETPDTTKRKGWPKGKARRPAPVAAPTFSGEQFTLLIETLANKRESGAGIDAETLKGILTGVADVSARTMRKAMKPENPTHPGLSAFSYPEGDQAHPKPVLPFELFWNGYPTHMFPETEHWRELELMCALTPGDYPVLRKDGSKMTVSVVGERNADDVVTKLTVTFPVSREEKWLVSPTMVTLYQMIHTDRPLKQAFMEAMQAYFGLIFGETAADA